MTSPSAFPQFVDKLVSIFDAAVSVPVFDGPWTRDEEPAGYVSVGWDGDPENLDAEVGDISQEFHEVGNFAKRESADVTCAVVAWNGADDGSSVKAARDLAFDYLSDCEQALRAALAPIGGDAALKALVHWCGIAAGSVTQSQFESGAQVRIGFTVHYEARI